MFAKGAIESRNGSDRKSLTRHVRIFYRVNVFKNIILREAGWMSGAGRTGRGRVSVIIL